MQTGRGKGDARWEWCAESQMKDYKSGGLSLAAGKVALSARVGVQCTRNER